MNERIRELAEQAGVDAGQTIANTICGDDEWVALGNEFNKLSQKTRDLIYKTLEQNQEKFAELIVQECADQIISKGTDWVDFAPSQTGVRPEYWNMAQQIKQHFGVKE